MFYVDQSEYDELNDRRNDKIGRYPHGFRHYENFNAYKYVNKDSGIQDYIEEMNKPCEFEEFSLIIKAGMHDEKKTASFAHEFLNDENDDGKYPIEDFM